MDDGRAPVLHHLPDLHDRRRRAGVNGELKALLLSILKAYETGGEQELTTTKLGQLLVARYGSVGEGKAKLGELSQVKARFKQMQAELYAG